MRDNKRITPMDGIEKQDALSAKLAVLSKHGSWQALREEIQRMVFEVEQLREGSIESNHYCKFEAKVRVAIAKLEQVCAIIHELKRQGAPDT